MVAISQQSAPIRQPAPSCGGSLWKWREQWKQPSDIARHYYYVIVAVLFFLAAQLLTCAWNQPFRAYNLDFPGQILAMMFVWVMMWTVQVVFFKPGEGLELFYHRHLKPPTEVLNKHMSIGFTIPFLNLISQSFAGADQVGLLTAAFVITGVLNAVLVYVVTYHIQYRSTKFLRSFASLRRRRRPKEHVLDVETVRNCADVPPSFVHQDLSTGGSRRGCEGPRCVNEQSCLDRFRKHVSDVSTLCTLSGYASDTNGPTRGCVNEERRMGRGQPEDALRVLEHGTGGAVAVGPHSPPQTISMKRITRQIVGWVQHNILLTLSILVFLLVGLPLSCLHGNDLFLDIGFLFTIWLTFATAQTRVKHHITLHRRRHSHFQPVPIPKRPFLTTLATLLNPVLWTSLSLLCYGLAKSHLQSLPPASIVERFVTNNTLADFISGHVTPTFGAGDIATSLLNAGIVSWGLKLFEYRAQVASRRGCTVLLTSALAALFNIVAWPLLVRHLGVHPAGADLSFAARSVTIALGGPAMTSLGGDAGVNAVGVVVNGICFQLVAGLFVDVEGGFAGVVWRVRRKVADWMGRSTFKPVTESEKEVDMNQGRNNPVFVDDGRRHEHTLGLRYSSDATHVDEYIPHQHRRLPTPSPYPGAAASTAEADSTTTSGNAAHSPASSSESESSRQPRKDTTDVHTVAAGVTIGINAAAMGTAHLYEQNSAAAPYSALSMTMLGVFTVLFTVQSPMVDWLVGMVSQ